MIGTVICPGLGTLIGAGIGALGGGAAGGALGNVTGKLVVGSRKLVTKVGRSVLSDGKNKKDTPNKPTKQAPNPPQQAILGSSAPSAPAISDAPFQQQNYQSTSQAAPLMLHSSNPYQPQPTQQGAPVPMPRQHGHPGVQCPYPIGPNPTEPPPRYEEIHTTTTTTTRGLYPALE